MQQFAACRTLQDLGFNNQGFKGTKTHCRVNAILANDCELQLLLWTGGMPLSLREFEGLFLAPGNMPLGVGGLLTPGDRLLQNRNACSRHLGLYTLI